MTLPAVPPRVVRPLLIAGVFLLAVATVSWAHDMFLRPAQSRVAPNSTVMVRILNGTFSVSENAILKTRVRDATIAGPRARVPVDMSTWTESGDTTTFQVPVRGQGTYVIGVSTRPSMIALPGDTFNMYLRDDGIPDILAQRRAKGELNKPSRERYHKHVKAIVQVGDSLGDSWSTVFGYPAEIVPLENPYAVRSGGGFRFRVLVDGKPAANQYILYGGRDAAGGRIEQKNIRSGADGTARIMLPTDGDWYVKFIHMEPVADSANYESKWATLTFSIRR